MSLAFAKLTDDERRLIEKTSPTIAAALAAIGAGRPPEEVWKAIAYYLADQNLRLTTILRERERRKGQPAVFVQLRDSSSPVVPVPHDIRI